MSDQITFQIEQLNFYYGNTQALRDVNMTVLPREITALIGPSGCGKSTFLRCLNRMNDTITDTVVVHCLPEITLLDANHGGVCDKDTIMGFQPTIFNP